MFFLENFWQVNHGNPLGVQRKLSVYKTFERRPGRLLNFLYLILIYTLRPGGMI